MGEGRVLIFGYWLEVSVCLGQFTVISRCSPEGLHTTYKESKAPTEHSRFFLRTSPALMLSYPSLEHIWTALTKTMTVTISMTATMNNLALMENSLFHNLSILHSQVMLPGLCRLGSLSGLKVTLSNSCSVSMEFPLGSLSLGRVKLQW